MNQQPWSNEVDSDDACLVAILEQARSLDPDFIPESLELLQAFFNTCKNMHGNLAGLPYSYEILSKLSQSVASLRLSNNVCVPDVVIGLNLCV